jgi:hypothetical protein
MLFSPSSSTNPERRSVILHSYSTQNQQRPYQKLSEKWLLITSLSGCSLEQKLPSSVTHSPDRTRPGTPFLTSAIPGLRSALECRNLISSNSFAHRLGTGNSALRLAPGPVRLKPELRQWRSEFIYKISLFGGYHWKRGRGERRPGWRQGYFRDNSIIIKTEMSEYICSTEKCWSFKILS